MDILTPQLLLAIAVFVIGAASPGPATMLIAATSMERGRQAGLATVAGICCGSATWGLLAALGFGAALATYAWLAEILRYVGGAYLLLLAFKAARSAWRNGPVSDADLARTTSLGASYRRGLMLHLSNPKAILVWVSTIAIAIPPGAENTHPLAIFAILEAIAIAIFVSYALLFALPPARSAYRATKRYVDALAAGVFAIFGLGLLLRRV